MTELVDSLRTHSDIPPESSMTPFQELLCNTFHKRFESGDIPRNYILTELDGDTVFSFAREDALPVPENEEHGANVHVTYQNEQDCYSVTLYHEDGTDKTLGLPKGLGVRYQPETFIEAIDVACEAMRMDDQLATADWFEIRGELFDD